MKDSQPSDIINFRGKLRYPSPDKGVIDVVRVSREGEEKLVPALIVNESHQGMACVLVGPVPAKDETFFFQETEHIRSAMVMRHHQEIDKGIQRLGFELTGEVIRT